MQRMSDKLWARAKISTPSSILSAKGMRKFLKTVVRNPMFDYFVGVVIIANSCAIAVQTQLLAKEMREPAPDLFRSLDMFFTVFFSIELVLRFIVESKKFFTGKNKHWNFFDTTVVAISIVEEIIGQMSTSTAGLRLVRVMRLVRLARFIRVMHFFRELRAMVWGIMHSIMSLVWVVFLLIFIMFFFSCYLTQAVTDEFMQDAMPSTVTEEDKHILRTSFGGLMDTMYSLYLSITGGQDWSFFSDPLFKLSTWLGLVYCFYIAFAVFAVLNVVTGVFVENAMKSTELDTDMMIVEENTKRIRITQALKACFHGADTDRSGTIEWEEFQQHFKDPAVQAYFRQLGLDLDGPGVQGIWELLDFDQNGSLSIDEMVGGAVCLKGPASCLDLAREGHDLRTNIAALFEGLEKMQKTQTDQANALQQDMRKLAAGMEKKSLATRSKLFPQSTQSMEAQRKNSQDPFQSETEDLV
jgi:hypothetical protein